MKKLLISILSLICATGLYAGSAASYNTSTTINKEKTTSSDFYSTGEKNVTVFGTYSLYPNHGGHAYGGGLEGQYFFHKNLGVGLEGMWLNTPKSTYNGLVTGTVRFPIQRFAPYAFIGAGGTHQDTSNFLYQFGAGLEYRFMKNVGWKTDYSRNFSDGKHSGLVRTGISLSF